MKIAGVNLNKKKREKKNLQISDKTGSH